jgi:hypothetical protein
MGVISSTYIMPVLWSVANPDVHDAGSDWCRMTRTAKIAMVQGYAHGVMSTILGVNSNYSKIDPAFKANQGVLVKIKRDVYPERLGIEKTVDAIDSFYSESGDNMDVYIGDAIILVASKENGCDGSEIETLKKQMIQISRQFK